jgi:hypothetical protein
MKRSARIRSDRSERVELFGAAQVHHRQAARRLHGRDPLGHGFDCAVRHREEQDAGPRELEPRSRWDESSVKGAGQAAAEVTPARDSELLLLYDAD